MDLLKLVNLTTQMSEGTVDYDDPPVPIRAAAERLAQLDAEAGLQPLDLSVYARLFAEAQQAFTQAMAEEVLGRSLEPEADPS